VSVKRSSSSRAALTVGSLALELSDCDGGIAEDGYFQIVIFDAGPLGAFGLGDRLLGVGDFAVAPVLTNLSASSGMNSSTLLVFCDSSH